MLLLLLCWVVVVVSCVHNTRVITTYRLMANKVDAKYQTALQRKIFTRWINQKLVPAKCDPITDCVEDFKDGFHLTKLLEVLSEISSDIKVLLTPYSVYSSLLLTAPYYSLLRTLLI